MNKWQSEQVDAPEAVNQAVNHYRRELLTAIKDLQQPDYEVDDRVELVSSSYEDAGLFSGDTGIVIDVKSTTLTSGHMQYDIRVEWDKGSDACWISAEDFTKM
ncbi:hypothetical protein ACFVS2_20530 [Brevibacillus sp. NPDC058079]|uniref:hypothetical protein n=1 Tax=Brevibacillus sp. NPDC058079 TaxID=3346330 RepID=UPI0036E49807